MKKYTVLTTLLVPNILIWVLAFVYYIFRLGYNYKPNSISQEEFEKGDPVINLTDKFDALWEEVRDDNDIYEYTFFASSLHFCYSFIFTFIQCILYFLIYGAVIFVHAFSLGFVVVMFTLLCIFLVGRIIRLIRKPNTND